MAKLRKKLPNNSKSRPMFSLGVAAVWLVVGVVVQIGYGPLLRESNEAHLQAARLVARDPLISVNPTQMKVVHAVNPDFENDFLLDFMRKKSDAGGVKLVQAEFDEIAETAALSLSEHPFRRLGLVPADGSPSAFATHVLVHEGVLHLIASLALLMLAAPLLEKRWGSWVLGMSSLLIVFASASAHVYLEPESQRALAGGSALIAGLVAAVVIRPRGESLEGLDWLPDWTRLNRKLPAWSLGCIWLVYEASLFRIAQGALPQGIDNTVGYTAHAAAAVLGGVLALLWRALGIERAIPNSDETEANVAERKEARFDLDRALDLKAKGEVDAAFAMLDREVERSARNRDIVMIYWHMAIERGQADHAAPVLMRLIEEELRRGADAMACELWQAIRENAPGALLDARILIRLIPRLAKECSEDEVKGALRQALDEKNLGLTPMLAAQVARMAAELDPSLASQAARCALSAKNLDEKLRSEMKMLVAAVADSKAEERKPEPEKAYTPPVNVFFAASDRSAFGSAGDLAEMANETFPDGAIREAVPLDAIPEGLSLAIDGGEPTLVVYSRMRALAIVGVNGLAPKPIALMDILIDGSGDSHPLTVLRIRCDQFDPRVLIPDAESSTAAMRMIVETLSSQGVQVLADITAGTPESKQIFDSLDDYHEKILRPVASQFA